MRGKGSRTPAGPWSRLKPVDEDPLDSMGLPSKGDNRLLELKAQEKYYTQITERYVAFCSSADGGPDLLGRFASLSIQAQGTVPAPRLGANTVQPDPAKTSPEDVKTLSSVLSALRKLREAIVATRRSDEFAVQAYLFCIRLGILVQQPEAYHPAALHLLRAIHPSHPLTAAEITEVVSYLVLDAACRRGALSEAYAIRAKWKLRDSKVDQTLRALAHDDFVAFGRLRSTVDGHRARLLEFAEPEVRRHALKCLGKSYLAVEKEFVERATGREWEVLTKEDGVEWELEGGTVVIRRVKAR